MNVVHTRTHAQGHTTWPACCGLSELLPSACHFCSGSEGPKQLHTPHFNTKHNIQHSLKSRVGCKGAGTEGDR